MLPNTAPIYAPNTSIGRNIPPGAPDENENIENRYFKTRSNTRTPSEGTAMSRMSIMKCPPSLISGIKSATTPDTMNTKTNLSHDGILKFATMSLDLIIPTL